MFYLHSFIMPCLIGSFVSTLLLSSTSTAGSCFEPSDAPTVATCPAPNTQNSARSLSSQHCGDCCDRYCLLSTRKFVWVLLGPGLVSPRPKQIQPAAAFHSGLFNSECVQCIPTSLSQCCPCFLLNIKDYRDSSRDSAATLMVSVPMAGTWLQLVQVSFLFSFLFPPYDLFYCL